MEIQILQSITSISENIWRQITPVEFPFVSYPFLEALESSKCLGSRTGWTPIYFTAWEKDSLVGALLNYIKTNSYGEYIFDFAWAHAYDSSGLAYYPKMVTAVPFTPATGAKILIHPSQSQLQRSAITTALLTASLEFGVQIEASSHHALFITEPEIPFYERAGLMIRHSYQYHWRNQGYQSFADFLLALRAKRRREILRERNQVQATGVQVTRLTGPQLETRHAETMFRFYQSTIHKMGGFSYLTVDFFKHVFESMRDQILLVLATDKAGHEVAGALNFFGNSTLYGRYWGCLDDYKALHFELCYYQGIEFAIERKFQLFEAGAQGEHKFQRGFLPTMTYSAHGIRHPEMKAAVQDFIGEEKRQIARLFDEYSEHSPFQRG